MNGEKRDNWSSGFGFVMSAAGSAIGLGNIWKFPYVCGMNGGAVFLSLYILFAVILGYPILLTELAIGRSGQMNAVDSCRKIHPKWGFAGGFGIIGSVAVLSYYSVVGGWVMRYAFSFISGNIPKADEFTLFASKTAEPILWQMGFIILTTAVIISGVSGGIEKVSSFLIPSLLIFLTAMMIYSCSLPDAVKGVRFFLIPDSSDKIRINALPMTAVRAMGQVFFSLSLGMGTLITYGSYLKKDFRLSRGTVSIIVIDTIIAVISGLIILPAVFSAGIAPDEGAGLIFSALTEVFGRLSAGRFLGSLFFILVFSAALTSSISLLEVIVSFLSEKTNLSRAYAALLASAVIFLFSVPASLSHGILSDVTIMGLTVFDFFIFLSDNIIMPLGAFFLCILAGHLWKNDMLYNELTSGNTVRFMAWKAYLCLIRYICPALIIIITTAAFIM